jgi:hypothetical protein
MPEIFDHYSHWDRYLAYVLEKYGLKAKKFWEMWERQDGKCAICRRAVKLTIDHNHKTRRVRGLLCYYCNGILGRVEAFPIILKNIRRYLRG